MKHTAQIRKTDGEKRIAYGIVYEPGVPDSHGDYMTASEIEKAAHKFLANGSVKAIDTEHDLSANGAVVVECFVARKGDADFPEGAWVMGVHFPDEAEWDKVKKGEYGGFSMYGTAVREDDSDDVILELPDDGLVWGTTADAEGHSHRYVIKFDDEGRMVGGLTDEGPDGHTHTIQRGTVTETDGDHAHRFDFLENFK